MTLVNDERSPARTITIEFYNPDRSPRGRVDLVKAVFNQARALLEAMRIRDDPHRPHQRQRHGT
jgi:hypothetical protein